jgi:hypothetical protein
MKNEWVIRADGWQKIENCHQNAGLSTILGKPLSLTSSNREKKQRVTFIRASETALKNSREQFVSTLLRKHWQASVRSKVLQSLSSVNLAKYFIINFVGNCKVTG